MDEKGISAWIVVGVIVVAAVAIVVVLFSSRGSETLIGAPASALMFDDFDDTTLGPSFPNTSAGMMSGNGSDDPEFEFVQVGSGYALKLMFDFPATNWCGYWSFLRPDENPATPGIEVSAGYDLSSYTTLKMAVKGESVGDSAVRFKIEMTDTVFNTGSEENFLATQNHRGTISTDAGKSWEEISIPLSQFTASGPSLNLNDVRQINIVFDQAPREGSLYIDWIAFE